MDQTATSHWPTLNRNGSLRNVALPAIQQKQTGQQCRTGRHLTETDRSEMSYYPSTTGVCTLAWMTINQLADKSGKSRRTIERAIKDHFLLSRKTGRDRQVWYSPEGNLPLTEGSQSDSEQILFLRSQLETKDQQITELQKMVDQSQQLQALSENRLQTTEQKLILSEQKKWWQRLLKK